MANIAYIRVSTEEQNEARQIEALSHYNISKTFIDKVSGKNIKDRKGLLDLLDWVREGDTVFVLDFSRLARNTRDLLSISDRLMDQGVRLVSLKENLDSNTPTGKLMLTMIGAINEFERQCILERQAEGIALAKKRGVYKGRKSINIIDIGRHYDRYMKREISKPKLAEELGISRATLDKLFKQELEARNCNKDWENNSECVGLSKRITIR